MAAHLLVLLFSLCLATHLNAMGDASSSTIATQWGGVFNQSNRQPSPGTFYLCVLEAGTLLPECAGTFMSPVAPPVPMLGIASGAYFSCGLRYDSGVPVCWASNSSTNGSSVPSKYQTVRYTGLAVGKAHVCGWHANGGAVDCWGYDQAFKLQNQSQNRFLMIAAGWGFTCGLTELGRASCWGAYAPSEAPDVVLKAIYAGGTHACGIENNTGLAFCWGDNTYHQANSTINYKFSFMALGNYHSCGILRDNHTVLCWGDDAFSQVSSTPRNERFSTISAGDFYTCGVSLSEPQRVKCWGNKVIYTLTTTKVSQGICTNSTCGADQYQLSDDAAQCPAKGDRICLECPGGTGCKGGLPAPLPPSAPSSGSILVWPIVVGVLGGALAICTAVYVCWCMRRRRKRVLESGQHRDEEKMQHWQRLSNRVISFDSVTLRNATFNYSNQMVIGTGASGVVYKAILPDQQVLAIKKEVKSFQNLPDTFSTEIELLSRLHHTFLTNLVGFCEEDKLLVYEFMENGSLSGCLFEKPRLELNLALRIRIAAQAARGLEYLHLYASPRIIHRDVKSQNILLDKDWNAHVSDFGLSTLGPGLKDTHLTMAVVGTPGYLDPAYHQTMQLNSSSDVYSFGVVLMELLCGRKAVQHQISLVSWVKNGLKNSENVFDKWLLQSTSSSTAVAAMLALAVECTNKVREKRPTMSVVALRLEVLLSSMDEVPSASWSSDLKSSGGSSSYSASTDSKEAESALLPR